MQQEQCPRHCGPASGSLALGPPSSEAGSVALSPADRHVSLGVGQTHLLIERDAFQIRLLGARLFTFLLNCREERQQQTTRDLPSADLLPSLPTTAGAGSRQPEELGARPCLPCGRQGSKPFAIDCCLPEGALGRKL